MNLSVALALRQKSITVAVPYSDGTHPIGIIGMQSIADAINHAKLFGTSKIIIEMVGQESYLLNTDEKMIASCHFFQERIMPIIKSCVQENEKVSIREPKEMVVNATVFTLEIWEEN